MSSVARIMDMSMSIIGLVRTVVDQFVAYSDLHSRIPFEHRSTSLPHDPFN